MTIIPTVVSVIPAIMAVIAPFLAAIVTAFITIVPALVARFVTGVLFAVTRSVFVVIPAVLDEIDTLAAGAVTVAIPAPVFRMAGRDAQVNRRAFHDNTLDNTWLGVDQRRFRIAAQVKTAVKPGLANTDRYADIAGLCRGGYCGSSDCQGCENTFHGCFLFCKTFLINAPRFGPLTLEV